MEAVLGFYRELLGLPELRRQCEGDGSVRSVWLGAEGVVVMVERAAAGEPAVSGASMELVAFAVSAAEREVLQARLAAAGVAVEARTEHTVYVRDPEGRRVGLSSYAL